MRNPYRRNPMPLRQPQRNLKQPWQHLHMPVPVEMRRLDSRVAHLLNLRVPFALHFVQQHTSPRQLQQQTLRFALQLASVVQKGSHQFPFRHRFAIAQIQMYAHSQPRRRPRHLHAGRKRRAIGQQGSARHDSVAMRFGYPSVDALRPPQVIRVYD